MTSLRFQIFPYSKLYLCSLPIRDDVYVIHYILSINSKRKIKFSEYWCTHEEQLSLMSATVRRANIIPASSVPCESTFSVAGYIRRKERSSLSPVAIKHSLVLKDRKKLKLIQK